MRVNISSRMDRPQGSIELESRVKVAQGTERHAMKEGDFQKVGDD